MINAGCPDGSWNRKPRSGYKVIFVPFDGGHPSGTPIDVLTGFVKENGDAMGRPSAWRLTLAGRFSSPTMSATRSGE